MFRDQILNFYPFIDETSFEVNYSKVYKMIDKKFMTFIENENNAWAQLCAGIRKEFPEIKVLTGEPGFSTSLLLFLPISKSQIDYYTITEIVCMELSILLPIFVVFEATRITTNYPDSPTKTMATHYFLYDALTSKHLKNFEKPIVENLYKFFPGYNEFSFAEALNMLFPKIRPIGFKDAPMDGTIRPANFFDLAFSDTYFGQSYLLV